MLKLLYNTLKSAEDYLKFWKVQIIGLDFIFYKNFYLMFCNKVSEVLFSTNYQNQENRSKFVETQSLNLPDQTKHTS